MHYILENQKAEIVLHVLISEYYKGVQRYFANVVFFAVFSSLITSGKYVVVIMHRLD